MPPLSLLYLPPLIARWLTLDSCLKALHPPYSSWSPSNTIFDEMEKYMTQYARSHLEHIISMGKMSGNDVQAPMSTLHATDIQE
jgi:hypothetical protein